MPRRYRDDSGAGNGGYERQPLVDIGRNSNARPASASRRSLPAGNWRSDKGLPDMDKPDPRKTECLRVIPAIDNQYLDCDDTRGRDRE